MFCFSLHYLCKISIFSSTRHIPSDILFMFPAFTFAFLSNTAAHKLKMSPRPSDLQHFFFSLICPTATLSFYLSASLSVCLSQTLFSLSHICGCLTPHTPLASLVSRTLATRTVMSSMRSWIPQLWPPLPAHEALLTLALGTLSSMQPSSLAHTSACHYRPFPSDSGLKVHRLMHSFPSFIPLSRALTPPLFATCGSLVYLPLESWPSFWFSPRGSAESLIEAEVFQVIIATENSTWGRGVHFFGTTDTRWSLHLITQAIKKISGISALRTCHVKYDTLAKWQF